MQVLEAPQLQKRTWFWESERAKDGSKDDSPEWLADSCANILVPKYISFPLFVLEDSSPVDYLFEEQKQPPFINANMA